MHRIGELTLSSYFFSPYLGWLRNIHSYLSINIRYSKRQLRLCKHLHTCKNESRVLGRWPNTELIFFVCYKWSTKTNHLYWVLLSDITEERRRVFKHLYTCRTVSGVWQVSSRQVGIKVGGGGEAWSEEPDITCSLFADWTARGAPLWGGGGAAGAGGEGDEREMQGEGGGGRVTVGKASESWGRWIKVVRQDKRWWEGGKGGSEGEEGEISEEEGQVWMQGRVMKQRVKKGAWGWVTDDEMKNGDEVMGWGWRYEERKR